MIHILKILALVFSANAAIAQSYPEYSSTTVNDFAGLLDEGAEARLSKQLSDLRKTTGVEMTILTLSRQDMFAPDQTLENSRRACSMNGALATKAETMAC